MGRIRKKIYDLWPSSNVQTPQIPLQDRTMNQVLSLKNLNIDIKKGSFTVIIGATGSGKSTLLNALLGQLIYVPKSVIEEVKDQTRPIKDGEQRYLEEIILSTDLSNSSPIQINGKIGYSEQQPWIQNNNVRNNVLFGSEFDKRRYVETIMACQLEPDLEMMTAGDDTEIGEKGINLSGG